MENIKNLMGSAYHEGVTVEEVNSFLSGKKMVNLNEGGYISKEKYERLENDKKTLDGELNSLKEATKDYETLKTENEGFKKAKADADLKETLTKNGIDAKYLNYVKLDIDGKVLEFSQDEKVNKTNVEKYLKDHPQFASKPTDQSNRRVITVTTGIPANNNNNNKPTVNSFINTGIREASGRKVNVENDVDVK